MRILPSYYPSCYRRMGIFGLSPNGISQEPPTDKLIDFEEYDGGCRRGQKVNKIRGLKAQ